MSLPWPSETIEACLERIQLPRGTGLKTRDYGQVGRYPIVDQGQALIAGWTHATDRVISDPLPVIVFGDHTRTFKYVDFPFVRGADGTQILKPRPGVNPLYFYFACRSLDLASRGYNRHFKLLKEQTIPLPGRSEQARIAQALQQAEDYVLHQEAQLSATRRLMRATARHLFSRGRHDEPASGGNIGPVPGSWIVESIDHRYDVTSGTTPSRSNQTYWAGGTIPWVKTAEVQYTVIRATAEHITHTALNSGAARVFPEGTLLLAMYGQGVTRGKVAMLGTAAACNQACAALTPKDSVLAPRYLYHFLTWRYAAIRSLAHGGQQQNLNLDIVRAIPVAYPPHRDEQETVVAVLDAIDDRIATLADKLAAAKRLMSVLLQRLISGEIRVDDLELDVLTTNAVDTG